MTCRSGRDRGSRPCSCEICGTDVDDGNLATDLSSLPVPTAAAAEAFSRTFGMLCSLLPDLLPAAAATALGEEEVSDSKTRVASLRAVSRGSCCEGASGVLRSLGISFRRSTLAGQPGSDLYLFPDTGDAVEVVDGAVVASEQLLAVAAAAAAGAHEEAIAAVDDDGWNRFSAAV